MRFYRDAPHAPLTTKTPIQIPTPPDVREECIGFEPMNPITWITSLAEKPFQPLRQHSKKEEVVGFEPTEAINPYGFQDRCNQPLCHTSKCLLNFALVEHPVFPD